MNFAQITTEYVCGVDLHGKTNYICIMNKEGTIFKHFNMRNNINQF